MSDDEYKAEMAKLTKKAIEISSRCPGMGEIVEVRDGDKWITGKVCAVYGTEIFRSFSVEAAGKGFDWFDGDGLGKDWRRT